MAISDKDQKQLQDAFHSKALTDSQKDYWQERLERHQSVPAMKSVQASEVIAGTNGTWTGSFSYSQASVNVPTPTGFNFPVVRPNVADVPNNANSTEFKLGKPGLPEVNFVPYSHRTNRYASKGPSLVGHPISFSVVGPTLKSPTCDWQWDIVDNSGTPGVGDTLTMAPAFSGSSTAVDLAGGYNITGSISDYNGGLYVVISDLGNIPGQKDAASDDIIPVEEFAQGEIFRVESFAGATLTLSPNKRLADYYTIPVGAPAIRGVMIIQPFVSRMAAIPNATLGKGRETSFVTVSPEFAANTDLFPPYDGGTPSDGTWLQGGFSPIATQGEPSLYGGRVALPVPIPTTNEAGTSQVTGFIEINSPFPAELVGLTTILFDPGVFDFVANDVGLIIKVSAALSEDNAQLDSGEYSSLFGYFEIVSVGVNSIVVSRIPEVNPSTGQVFYGPGPYVTVAQKINMSIEIFEPVSRLFSGNFDFDKVNAARLQNIIDPTWVDRSTKGSNPTDPTQARTPGFSAGGARNALFDTSFSGTGGGANPGNLADIGFGIVLFAAKDDGGDAVPDFDNPIIGNEVILDPAITTETQTISYDYASGVLALSHPPVPGVGCDIAPNGIVGAAGNNPRGEIVLFIACIPYSMENGQTGPGVRVVGGDINAAITNQNAEAYFDVYSAPALIPINPQTINNLSSSIELTTLVNDELFPETGVVEILTGSEDGAYELESYGTFGYQSKGLSGSNVTLTSLYTDVGLPLNIVDRSYVRLKKSPQALTGLDNTFGSASRSNTVRFKYADLTPNLDGSVTVDIDSPKFYENWDDLFSTWIISGGEITPLGGFAIQVNPSTLLVRGRRVQLNSELITLPPNDLGYIYVDATEDPQSPSVRVTASLPLPGNEDILLAFWETDGISVSDIKDLRNPLTDIDQRLDILVGTWTGHTQQTTHFQTLSEAVAYVGEIMDPTNGDDGSYLRIKVVGSTDETGLTPIQIPCNGLIIEGARLEDNSSSNPHGIQFRDVGTPLIELNSKNNLIIRDLVFVCPDDGQAASTDPLARTFLVSTVGFSSNTLIENCLFVGNDKAHGLFYSSSNILIANFKNCIATGLTDFGIYIDDNAACENLTVDNCWIQSGGIKETTDITAPYKAAVRHSDFNATTSTINKVKDCVITGFEMGVYSQSSMSYVDDNYFTLTEGPAIWFGPNSGEGNKINGNTLDNVFVGVPGTGLLPTAKIGIYSNHASEDTISENNITAILGGGNSIALDSNSMVKDNHCDDGILVSSGNCTITNNRFDTFTGIFATSCNIVHNVIESNVLTSSITTGTTFSDNRTGGGLELYGSNCTISGNSMTSISLAGGFPLATSLLISNNRMVTGSPINLTMTDSTFAENVCTNTVNITGDSVNSTNNKISGNLITTGSLTFASTAPAPSQVVISNNNIVNGSLSVDGDYVAIVGNMVFSDITIGTTSADRCTITGNDCDGVNGIDIINGSHTINGNSVSTINAPNGDNIISGNRIASTISVGGDRNNIAGNNCTGININAGGINTIHGNAMNGGSIIFAGAAGDRNVVSSNTDLLNINMNLSTSCSVTSNQCSGSILVNGIDYIIMGNRATQVNDPGFTNTDPDAAQGIIVGNRFTLANPIFGAAGGGTAKDHNP